MLVAGLILVGLVLGGGALVNWFGPRADSEIVQESAPILIGALEALLFIPIAWVLQRHNLGWDAVGLRMPTQGWARAARSLLVALVLSYTVMILWGLFLLPFDVRPQENIFPRFLGTGQSVLVLVLISGAIIAPIAEEVFFRGFLFAGLQQHYSLPTAYVVSAGIFALVHFTPAAFPPLVALGIFLAWLYQRNHSIWPPVFLHATVNTLTLIAWYAEATGTLS